MIEIFQELPPMLATAFLPALAAVGSLAATGASIAMAAGNRVGSVPTRSLGQEIDDILARRGKMLASDKSYLPEQSRLEREIAAEAVFGRDEGKQYAEAGALESSMEAARRLNEFDIGQAGALAPRAMGIFQQNAPYANLLQGILKSAESELAAGSSLDPVTAAQVRQQARAAMGERGLGADLAGAMMETTTLGMAGEEMRRRRQQYALQALQTGAAASPDLFRLITGRDTGINAGLMGQGGASGANLDTLLGYAQGVFGDNARMQMYKLAANREHTSQMANALGGLGGLIGSMGIRGGGGSFSSR